MIQNGHQEFCDAGFFILRTPTLPSDDFLSWTSGLETTSLACVAASSKEKETAWRNDIAKLRNRLREQIDRPEVSHALFVASPVLEAGIAHWNTDPDSKKGLQAERALVRYFTRMCTRCTPFGLFSGCSFGRISSDMTEPLELTLQSRQSYKTKTRLDYHQLFALTDSLVQDKRILRELRYWPNRSLHRYGRYWHYLEPRLSPSDVTYSQHLVKIETDAFIEAVMATSAVTTGANFTELLTSLKNEDVRLSDSDAENYLVELIENKFLISNLVPLVTGDSPLGDLITQLEILPSGIEIANKLRRVCGKLDALDKRGIGRDRTEYQDITTSLKGVASVAPERLIYQVDMAKWSDSVLLTPTVLDEILRSVEVLQRFTFNREDEALTNFRNAFIERYERAFVPLLDVLDEESGIGFGAQTVSESTAIPSGLQLEPGVSPNYPSLTAAHKFLLDRITSSFRRGSSEVRLDLSDIPYFEKEPAQLPASFCLHVELIASSHKALAAGDFLVLVNGTRGPDGARTLTRFCHVEPKLTMSIREYLRSAQLLESGAILAEVVHLPEGRYGNVLHRPVLREYEIVLSGRSGAPPDRQILASDLLVTVDEGREICLYSKSLGRRIIPRLTTAHGFSMGFLAPAFRFLGALQHQHGVDSPSFSWGPLASLSFLPRITVGRIILSVAQWYLVESEIKELTRDIGWKRFERVQEFRGTKLFPRFIELQEGDNTLLVDLDNPLSVEAFVQVLIRQNSASIREVFPGFQELCVTSEEGRFWHELEIPLIRRSADEITRMPLRINDIAVPSKETFQLRSFAVGSEWLYCKIYGGHSTLDEILKSHVRPLVERAVQDSLIDRWFFLRYADPRQHLRLRFHGCPEQLQRDLMPRLAATFEPSIRSGILWKLQFDTYVREVERYGGIGGTLLSEGIFHADSDAVLEVLEGLDASDANVRWRIALIGIDMLLADFALNDIENYTILQQLRDYCQSRFHLDKAGRKSVADHFRKERSSLEAIRDNAFEGDIWRSTRDIFCRRSRQIRPIATHLHDLRSRGHLYLPVSDLAKNCIHMYVNRIMSRAANEHELILYDFLFRLYDSDIARHQTTGTLLRSEGRSDNKCFSHAKLN